jgi:hypothetical protein
LPAFKEVYIFLQIVIYFNVLLFGIYLQKLKLI